MKKETPRQRHERLARQAARRVSTSNNKTRTIKTFLFRLRKSI